MDETLRSLRTALVDALAAEHRFRRQALQEGRELSRWEQRADMAAARELPDLAGQARIRADRHRRSAELFERRANEIRVQVERLQNALAAAQGHGRAPADAATRSLEGRFAALEVETELGRMREAATSRPNPSQTSDVDKEAGG